MLRISYWLDWRRGMNCSVALAWLAIAQVAPASAQTAIGSFTYFSNDSCSGSGRFSREICDNAKANAAAEFEEKAPHYPTRAACEANNGSGQCAISFRSGAQGSGSKSGVTFTVRQQGFKIVARSATDVTTIPLAKGLTFVTRTALARRTNIDPRVAQRALAAAKASPTAFGVSSPEGGVAGPLPPPVPKDPNFNCADFIDPKTKGDLNEGCAPAPRRPR